MMGSLNSIQQLLESTMEIYFGQNLSANQFIQRFDLSVDGEHNDVMGTHTTGLNLFFFFWLPKGILTRVSSGTNPSLF